MVRTCCGANSITVHLWIDWYLGLHIVGILLALILLSAFFVMRSADYPWVELRPHSVFGYYFSFLTIYPAINGGQFRAYDAATFYPSIVLGALLMFRLGNLIAKDISAVRRVFQLLAAVATIVAIHTIIETITGVFLFASAREDIHLVTSANLFVYNTKALQSLLRSS